MESILREAHERLTGRNLRGAVMGVARFDATAGTVTFADNGVTIVSVTLNSSGFAGFGTSGTSSLAVGNHVITAVYSGDANFTGSTATLTQTVNQRISSTAVTSSVNPSGVGQAVTFTATASSQFCGST